VKFTEAVRVLTEAGQLEAVRVLKDHKESKRKQGVQRRAATSRKMSAKLKEEIWELHTTTEMTNSQIAAVLGVNQGRISEVVTSRRRDPRFFD